MTWNEFNTAVWKSAGLSERQIAKGLSDNAKSMPGFGEQEAVFAPGNTYEQAIASGVRAFKVYQSLPLADKQLVQTALDSEMERNNQKN